MVGFWSLPADKVVGNMTGIMMTAIVPVMIIPVSGKRRAKISGVRKKMLL
jgi:hypothetical protein